MDYTIQEIIQVLESGALIDNDNELRENVMQIIKFANSVCERYNLQSEIYLNKEWLESNLEVLHDVINDEYHNGWSDGDGEGYDRGYECGYEYGYESGYEAGEVNSKIECMQSFNNLPLLKRLIKAFKKHEIK